jgi:hypothetical protein
VDGGLLFADAMKALAAFAARHPSKIWGSWGNADLNSINRDCEHHGIESPLKGWTHRNLKKEWAKARKIKQVGMKKALEIAGIELEGLHHDALADVLNIAKLYAGMDVTELEKRETRRRKALHKIYSHHIDTRHPALRELQEILKEDKKYPLGEAASMSLEELRAIVPIHPRADYAYPYVLSQEIPEPWRTRFHIASVGSTRSGPGYYAHDWENFLYLWQKEHADLADKLLDLDDPECEIPAQVTRMVERVMNDFLALTGEPLQGCASEEEGIALAQSLAPGKPYCTVKDWIIADLDLADYPEFHDEQNRDPAIMYSHYVLTDEAGRFRRGDWVRSTLLVSFSHGCIFESRNTVYVLIGPGFRKKVDPKLVMSVV